MLALPTLHGSHHYCIHDLNKSAAPLNITLLIAKMRVLDWGCGGAMPYDAQNMSAECQPCTRLWVTDPSLTPGAQSLTRE